MVIPDKVNSKKVDRPVPRKKSRDPASPTAIDKDALASKSSASRPKRVQHPTDKQSASKRQATTGSAAKAAKPGSFRPPGPVRTTTTTTTTTTVRPPPAPTSSTPPPRIDRDRRRT